MILPEVFIARKLNNEKSMISKNRENSNYHSESSGVKISAKATHEKFLYTQGYLMMYRTMNSTVKK
jgi:hypothetical protein